MCASPLEQEWSRLIFLLPRDNMQYDISSSCLGCCFISRGFRIALFFESIVSLELWSVRFCDCHRLAKCSPMLCSRSGRMTFEPQLKTMPPSFVIRRHGVQKQREMNRGSVSFLMRYYILLQNDRILNAGDRLFCKWRIGLETEQCVYWADLNRIREVIPRLSGNVSWLKSNMCIGANVMFTLTRRLNINSCLFGGVEIASLLSWTIPL